MINVISITLFSLFLAACASNNTAQIIDPPPIKYLDLSRIEQKGLVQDFWEVQSRKEPSYPISAARNGLSGCTALIIGINKDGKVLDYKIKNSYPKGVFDNHALAALKKWKWSATEKNIDRTPVLTSIQLDFRVSGANNMEEAKNKCGWGL